MCIAIWKPAGKTIDRETLQNCWDGNDDGAGFMVAHKGRLIIRKGLMTFVDFMREWSKVPDELPAVLHFRIRTHGLADATMTHPFVVKKDEIGMVHNGILPILVPKERPNWSDTKTFVEYVIKRLPEGWLNPESPYHNPLYHLIDGYLGSNKLIFLDAQGNHLIFNEDQGTWDKEVWFSNTTFRHRTVYLPYSNGWNYDGDGTYSRTYQRKQWDPVSKSLVPVVDGAGATGGSLLPGPGSVANVGKDKADKTPSPLAQEIMVQLGWWRELGRKAEHAQIAGDELGSIEYTQQRVDIEKDLKHVGIDPHTVDLQAIDEMLEGVTITPYPHEGD